MLIDRIAKSQSVSSDHEDVGIEALNDEVDRTTFLQSIALNDFGRNDENGSNLQIDSPTIFNNIGNMLLSENDGTMFLEDTHPSKPYPAKNTYNTCELKTLSNVPYNYQSIAVCNSFRGFSSIEQTEFDKFIRSLASNDFETFNTEMATASIIEREQGPFISMGFREDADIENVMEVDCKYEIDEWVIVEYKIKSKVHYFIGKIVDKILNTQEYKVLFLRKAQGMSEKIVWLTNCDGDIVPESHIVQRLDDPQESRRGQYIFKKFSQLLFKIG